mgnify:CR=1 FL=1
MEVVPLAIPDVLLVRPSVHADDRGAFTEMHVQDRYREAGIPGPFVQDNLSRSRRGVIRGLHYQLRMPQGKLISVVRGRIWDVAIDIRQGSPTFGQHVSSFLDDEKLEQIYVPPGFAHGFAAISDRADVLYKCTDTWHPQDAFGIRWDDPTLALPWPDEVLAHGPVLSERDKVLPFLEEALANLPHADAAG